MYFLLHRENDQWVLSLEGDKKAVQKRLDETADRDKLNWRIVGILDYTISDKAAAPEFII